MSDEFLGDRKKSMEEAFFHARESQVLERMRQARARDEAKQALARETGLKDDTVLERLVALGFTASNLIPLTVVPWLEVAWADGALDADEKEAILTTLDRSEIPEGSLARKTIEQWLETRPPRELFDSWCDYVRALLPTLKPEDRAWMKDRLLRKVKTIADASGGILSLAFRTSKAEADAIRRIEAAFEG